MARESYSDEFRRQGVGWYESTWGATLTGVAVDLGIGRGTLQGWVREFGAGVVAEPAVTAGAAGRESKTVRIARLEAESLKLTVERDILRAAAKYFAGETNW